MVCRAVRSWTREVRSRTGVEVGVGFGGATTPGVAGDPTGRGWGLVDRERTGRGVVHGAEDDGVGPRVRDLDGAAKEAACVIAPLEIVHLTGSAGVDPGFKARGVEGLCGVVETIDRDDAGELEVEVAGTAVDPLFQLEVPDAGHEDPALAGGFGDGRHSG